METGAMKASSKASDRPIRSQNSNYGSLLHSAPTGKGNAEEPEGQASMTAGQRACEEGDSHNTGDTLANSYELRLHLSSTVRRPALQTD